MLIALLFAFRTRYQVTLVLGSSMQPTLGTGDLLLVDKQAYQDATPRRGDIVVSHYQGDLIVKRIVGLPNEVVEVVGGTLHINDTAVVENYQTHPGPLRVGRGTLGPARYALLGDHRGLPAATLVHGVVPADQIIGKVVMSVPLLGDLLGFWR